MATVADAASILFAIPVVVYGYLLCLDAYNALGKDTKLPKWVEPFVLILMGLLILFTSFSEMDACKHHTHGSCKDTNASTFLFGVLMMMLGIVSLLNQNIEIFSFSADWVTPAVLVAVGILLPSSTAPSHSEGSAAPSAHDHGDFLGLAFTVCALSAAATRALMNVDPMRWGVLAAYAWSLTGFAHAVKSPAVLSYLSMNFTSHTIFLALCVIAALLLIPILLFIHYMTKGEVSHYKAPAKGGEAKGF